MVLEESDEMGKEDTVEETQNSSGTHECVGK